MAAITWRNVDAPSMDGVGRALQSAQLGIDNSFNTLGRVLKQREDAGIAQWDKGKAANTNAVLDRVSQAGSVEDLQALQASGEIGQMITGYGDQVDSPQLRDVLQRRLVELQNRGEAQASYEAGVRTRTDAPKVDAIGSSIARGDFAGARAGLDGGVYANESVMEANLSAAQRNLEMRGREDKDYARKSEQQNYDDTQLAPKRANAEAALKAETQSIADTAEASRLQEVLATKAQERNTELARGNTALGKIANGLGYPVNSQGYPDYSSLTEGQYLKLIDAGIVKGDIKKDIYSKGDTAAGNALFADISKSGQFKATTLEKFKSSILGSANTEQAGVVRGNDDYNQRLTNARYKVSDEELGRSNSYAPGSEGALAIAAKLTTNMANLINPDSVFQAKEDIPHMNAFVNESMINGVDIGNGVIVVPSEQDMTEALGKPTGGWFTDSQRAQDAEEELIKIMKRNGTASRAKEGQEAQIRNLNRKVQQELAAVRAPAKQ